MLLDDDAMPLDQSSLDIPKPQQKPSLDSKCIAPSPNHLEPTNAYPQPQ